MPRPRGSNLAGDRRPVTGDRLVPVAPEPEALGVIDAVFGFEIEVHALTLSQHPEDAARQRPGAKKHLLSIVLADDDAYPGLGVIYLNNALHRAEV